MHVSGGSPELVRSSRGGASQRLRICLLAASRFPIREPFQGGLEAQTSSLARGLIERGHDVTLFAGSGTDPSLGVRVIEAAPFVSSGAARSDVGAPAESWMREHHAYLDIMLRLVRSGGAEFDVVHNNSLHHLPVAMAPLLDVPMVTTIHTPPVPWLESAALVSPDGCAWVAVSEHTRRAWQHVVDGQVVHNGVDTGRWVAGPGGGRAIWFGRVVPEKAPHLAIDAARAAGLAIDLVGPVHDADYHRREIEPRLGSDVSFLGHRTTDELVELVGRAAVTVVSPAWDEPYGLVAAESMACGTPVACFPRGGLGEVVTAEVGGRAGCGTVRGLAGAIGHAVTLDRAAVRTHAVRHCSIEAMTDAYEALYARLAVERAWVA